MDMYDQTNDIGNKNEPEEFSDEQLLKNIQNIQNQNKIRLSPTLVKYLGKCSLDIEIDEKESRTRKTLKGEIIPPVTVVNC